MAVKRTNYVRASDGKFAHTAGVKAVSKTAAPGSKKKTRIVSKKTKSSNKLSAAKAIAADEKKLAKNGGTAGGTVTAKGFKKRYTVKVTKGKDGSTTRLVTRRSVKTVNGKRRVISVTRRTVTAKNGRKTVTRTVAQTGKKTVTKRTVTGGRTSTASRVSTSNPKVAKLLGVKTSAPKKGTSHTRGVKRVTHTARKRK